MAQKSAVQPPVPSPVSLTPRALGQIRKALLRQRGELEIQLRLEAQAVGAEDLEVSHDGRSEEDPAEAGSATFEREKHLSIAQNLQNLLEKNIRALERLELGTYGVCEACSRPIPPERLKALPHALLCFECKNAQERR